MSENLPPGWVVSPLGSLGDWYGGGTPSKAVKEYWQDGTVDWVSPKDMKRPLIDSAQDKISEKAVKESSTKLVPANSVLMVTRSGILEHSFPVAVNTIPVTMNQDLKAVAVRGVDPVYTSYFLQSRAQDILRTCKKDGTTVSSIDSDRLGAYEVAIAPANEQKRIVSRIDELFSRIDEGERALEQVQTLVERYRQSILKAAVTGELTHQWREKNKDKVESGEALLARILKARREAWETAELKKMKAKGIPRAIDKWKQSDEEPAPPNTTGMQELPAGWVWTSLAEMKLFSFYGPRFSSEDYAESGYLVLRTSDISESGRVNIELAPRLFLTNEEFKKYKVEKGDLLITRTGSLGTVAIFDDDVDAIPGAYLIQYRVPAPNVTRRYLFHFLRSPTGQNRLLRGGAGVGRPNVNAPTIEAIPIPLPPLAEQMVIVDRVENAMNAAERHIDLLQREATRSGSLRQAVLTAAFSGQLLSDTPDGHSASRLIIPHGASTCPLRKKP